MEFYSNNKYVRSSSIKSSSPYNNKRFLRSANLIREYKDFQYYDHAKRNLKGANVNSDSSANNENANNLITYEHLGESWIELVLPFTILGITVIGVVLIGVILFIWLRKYFSETREKCPSSAGLQSKAFCTPKKASDKHSRKMNSRKWLRGKNKQIDSKVVNDLEQKLETVEYKNSPPTSPNSQKQSDEQPPSSGESDSEGGAEILNEPEDLLDDDEDDDGDEKPSVSSAIIRQCPMAISDFSSFMHPQPSGSSDTPVQQVTPASSSLSLLQEEFHCIQPREDRMSKMFKSTATSPPPFSPLVHHHHHSLHKYATTGTQTYFTKAPNSPNNLLSSSFAVLQTPTTSTVPSGNPFALENKENKEPSKTRSSCLNKTISSFKQDNCDTSSSPSSPSSVISTSPKIATSPKVNVNVLQQQNSPLPAGESPPFSRQFNYSPKNVTSANSPSTIPSANYKFGNYFRFPDVGTPPVPPLAAKADDKSSSSSSSLNKQSSTNTSDESTDNAIKSFQNLNIESDKESIILKIDEVESPIVEMKSPTYNSNIFNNNNTLTIRRARLKSISLDSDGARLVEENLTMPVEELVEIASYNNKQIIDSDPNVSATSSSANNNNRYNPKNIYNLTINLDFRDSSLDVTEGSDINMNQDQEYDETDDGVCRTPTMKYFRNKKAVSLDSDHQEGGKNAQQKTASSETFNYYFGQSNSKMNSSISVPSTPKHLTSNKLKISTSDERSGHGMSCGRYSRKLGSFEENSDGTKHYGVTTQASQVYKTNLTASIQTLNVSSSNLKTLPEIMSVSDFDGNQSPKAGPRVGVGIPPSKSGILQRRGSNQSLTLNLDGSCGNLSRGLSCSNYSLGNIHGSHLSIAGSNHNLQHQASHRAVTVKKNLLQRRGSNTSLTLNVQESNNNLNRFNSHSSLNIAGSKQHGKGLLERRNSNASLTLNIQNRGLSISNCNLRGSECSLSSVNTNQMADLMLMEQEAEQIAEEEAAKDQENSRHQRKFLSSENLHNLSIHTRSSSHHHRQQSHHQTPYGSIDNLKHTQPYHEKIPVISTKPLSPQTTSEDFKIYLANIQFLQSASNVLDEEHLKTLGALFQKSYKTQLKANLSGQQTQFNNDDILNNRIGNDGPPISFANSSPDEDQKELLIKLHQEFWNLPTNYQEKPMVFGSQPKNRYKTILPNEHSRVILQKEEGCDVEPYINANFIKVSSTAGQAFGVEFEFLICFLGTGLCI